MINKIKKYLAGNTSIVRSIQLYVKDGIIRFGNPEFILPDPKGFKDVKIEIIPTPPAPPIVKSIWIPDNLDSLYFFLIYNLEDGILNYGIFIEDPIFFTLINYSQIVEILKWFNHQITFNVNFPERSYLNISNKTFIFNKQLYLTTERFDETICEKLKRHFDIPNGLKIKLLDSSKFSDLEVLKISEQNSPEFLSNLMNKTKIFKDFILTSNDELEIQSELDKCMKLIDLLGSNFVSHPQFLKNSLINPDHYGHKSKFPDYAYINQDGELVIIEIEKYNKRIINKNGTNSSEFSQSKSQISQWENIISKPSPKTSQIFEQFSDEFPNADLDRRKYLLIIGNDKLFKNDSEKKSFFSEHSLNIGHPVTCITWDDFVAKLLRNIERLKELNSENL